MRSVVAVESCSKRLRRNRSARCNRSPRERPDSFFFMLRPLLATLLFGAAGAQTYTWALYGSDSSCCGAPVASQNFTATCTDVDQPLLDVYGAASFSGSIYVDSGGSLYICGGYDCTQQECRSDLSSGLGACYNDRGSPDPSSPPVWAMIWEVGAAPPPPPCLPPAPPLPPGTSQSPAAPPSPYVSTTSNTPDGNATPVIVAAVAGGAVLVILAGVIFFWQRSKAAAGAGEALVDTA